MPDGEGFKMGDAYIEVHMDGEAAAKKAADDIRKSKGILGKAAEEAGSDAGKRGGDKLGDEITKSAQKKINTNELGLGKWTSEFNEVGKSVDVVGDKLDKLSKIKPPSTGSSSGGLKDLEAANDRLSSALRAQADQVGKVRVAELRLTELRESSTAKASQLAAAEERLAGAHRNAAAAQKAAAAAADALNAARSKAVEDAGSDAGKRAGEKLGDETIKSAQKKIDSDGPRLGKGLAASVFGGLPAAAAVGGVAVAGSMGILGASVVGMSGMVLASNQEVGNSFSQLGAEVRDSVKVAAAPMADDFVLAANKMRGAVISMEPQLIELFSAARPAVDHLAEGIAGLATNALPGMVTAVKRSEPVMAGFESFLKSTGTGVSDFFTNVSDGAESSGQVMQSTGHIVRDLGGFTGALFAQLSNSGSPAVRSLEAGLRQMEGTVLSLGAGAFPALATGASGFLVAGTGVLRLLQLFAPVLGPLTGDVLTFVATLKLVDMVSFGSVSSGINSVKNVMGEADGVGGKMKAGFGALAGSSLPILGIAAVGLSFVLDELGKRERDAAEAAAYHDKIVRGLTGTLDKNSGAVTGDTRSWVANQIAKDNVGKANSTLASQAGRLGISTEQVSAAVFNTNGELSKMDGSLRATVKSQILATASAEQLDHIHHMTGKTVDDLTTIYMGGAGGVDKFQAALAGMSQTPEDNALGLDKLGHSLQTSTIDARNLWGGVSLLSGSLTEAQKQQLQAAAAADEHTRALAALRLQMEEMVSKDLAYRNAVDSTADAQKAAADALQQHGAKSGEYADAVRGVEGAMIGQAQAAKNLALANSTATDDAQKAAEGQAAYAHEIVSMATAAGNTAPPALRQMLSSLSDSALAAQGASREIDGTGQAVYRLPNGKLITVSAADDATWRAARVNEYVQGLHDKWITIGINQITTFTSVWKDSAPGSQPLSAGRHARGGWIRGPGTTTSDSIPLLGSDKEFMVAADKAAPYASVLEDINAGRDPVLPVRGGKGPKIAGLSGSTANGTRGFTAASDGGGVATLSPAIPAPRSGDTYINNWYITAPPGMDLNALTEQLSRRLELRMRQGRGG